MLAVIFLSFFVFVLHLGYIDLIEVPIGATNIKISEIRSVRTYLGECCNNCFPIHHSVTKKYNFKHII